MHESHLRDVDMDSALQVFAASLGVRGYRIEFQELIDDLVKIAGVLIRLPSGELTFGHLTYQEHLVGDHLAEASSPKDIASLLGDPWWEEPLMFWASRREDITSLIEYCETRGMTNSNVKQLRRLSSAAQYTSQPALEILVSAQIANLE
jgi:hypothetical protein